MTFTAACRRRPIVAMKQFFLLIATSCASAVGYSQGAAAPLDASAHKRMAELRMAVQQSQSQGHGPAQAPVMPRQLTAAQLAELRRQIQEQLRASRKP